MVFKLVMIKKALIQKRIKAKSIVAGAGLEPTTFGL
jgi:hypothetical protein